MPVSNIEVLEHQIIVKLQSLVALVRNVAEYSSVRPLYQGEAEALLNETLNELKKLVDRF